VGAGTVVRGTVVGARVVGATVVATVVGAVEEVEEVEEVEVGEAPGAPVRRLATARLRDDSGTTDGRGAALDPVAPPKEIRVPATMASSATHVAANAIRQGRNMAGRSSALP
jgi:hypothetical protein